MATSISKSTVERTQLFQVRPKRAFIADHGILPVINPDQAMSNAFTEAPLPGKDEMKREDSLKWSQSYVKVDKPHLTALPKQKPRREIIFKRDIDETRDDYILDEVQKENIRIIDSILRRYDSIDYMSRQARNYFKAQTDLPLTSTSSFVAPLTPLEIQVLKSQIDRYDATLLTDTASIIKILRTPELIRYVLARSKMTNLTPEKTKWFDLLKKVATDIATKNRLFQIDWTMTPEQFDTSSASQPQSGMSASGGFPSGSVGGAPTGGMSGSPGLPWTGSTPSGAGFAPGASGGMGGMGGMGGIGGMGGMGGSSGMSGSPGFPPGYTPSTAGGMSGSPGFPPGYTPSNVPPGFNTRADDADQNPHPGQQQPTLSPSGGVLPNSTRPNYDPETRPNYDPEQNPPPSTIVPNSTKPDTAGSNVPTTSPPTSNVPTTSPPTSNVPTGSFEEVLSRGIGISGFFINDRIAIQVVVAKPMSITSIAPLATNVGAMYVNSLGAKPFYFVKQSDVGNRKIVSWNEGAMSINSATANVPPPDFTALKAVMDVKVIWTTELYSTTLIPYIPERDNKAVDTATSLQPGRGRTPTTSGSGSGDVAGGMASGVAGAGTGAGVAGVSGVAGVGSGVAGIATGIGAGMAGSGSQTTPPTTSPTTSSTTSIKDAILQLVNSSTEPNTAIQKIYQFLDKPGVIPDAVHQQIVQAFLANQTTETGRRLLSDPGDMDQTWILLRKTMINNRIITLSDAVEISRAIDRLRIANRMPPENFDGSNYPSITDNTGVLSYPPLKAKLLQIIKTTTKRDDAILSVYSYLNNPGVIPDSAHQQLLQEISSSSDPNKPLVDDQTLLWITIRKVLLQTKVLTNAEVLELKQAMDDKIDDVTTPANPNPSSGTITDTNAITFFNANDTFGDDSYDFLYAMFQTFMHVPNTANIVKASTFLTYIKSVAYIPNGWTFHFIGTIVNAYVQNFANIMMFTNTAGAYFNMLANGKSNQDMFDFGSTLGKNILSLYLYEAFGTGVNTLLRMMYKYGDAGTNTENWNRTFPAWIMLLLNLFFGGYGNTPKFTTSEKIQRFNQLGTLNTQKWVNLLMNSYLFVSQRAGNNQPVALFNSVMDEIGENSLFEIANWMAKDWDLDAVPPIPNVEQVAEENVPVDVLQNDAPRIGWNDVAGGQADNGAERVGGGDVQPVEQGGVVADNRPARVVQPVEQGGVVADNKPKPGSQDTGTETVPSNSVSDAIMEASEGNRAPGYQSVNERVGAASDLILVSNNPYITLNLRSRLFINTWGISLSSTTAVGTIFMYYNRIRDIANNLTVPESRQDPTSSGFIEFMGTGETPTLILIIRAVYNMFKVSMADDLARLGVLDTGDIMIRQYGNQQFTQQNQLEYSQKYGKFFYFCLTQLIARGIVENGALKQNRDPGAISVRKTAMALAMMLRFFDSIGAMGQYYNPRIGFDVLTKL